jgi:hypothetical protein
MKSDIPSTAMVRIISGEIAAPPPQASWRILKPMSAM